jgi:hypothetical protein
MCSSFEILVDMECINIMIVNQYKYKRHKITFIQKKLKELIVVDLVKTFPLYQQQLDQAHKYLAFHLHASYKYLSGGSEHEEAVLNLI